MILIDIFQQKNEEFFHKFVGQLKQGTLGTCEYALQVAREPDIKVTHSTLMANMLTIGDATNRPEDSIAINIQLAKATSVVAPPPMKKFAKRAPPQNDATGGESQPSKSAGETQSQNPQPTAPNFPYTLATFADVAPLEMRTEFVLRSSLKQAEELAAAAAAARHRNSGLDDEEGDENAAGAASPSAEESTPIQTVEKDELVKAYKYGQSWVPIEDDSSAADRLVTIKGMEIIGFSYEHSV